jgi:predicted HicB family RNase H-like nuclease
MLNYLGYHGEVVYDQETETFQGNVLLARGVATFEGRSVEELKQAFKDSVDDYLELCAQEKLEPEPPLNGHVDIRIPPKLQNALLAAAHHAGKSVDCVIVENLARDLNIAL